jgi:uncharacterized repeat protein (TIGR01451 family)
MSYTLQTIGIPDPTLPANNVDTDNNGVPDQRLRLDYSRSQLPLLREPLLLEPNGIGDGTDLATWTVNGGVAQTAAGNGPINWDGDNPPNIDESFVPVDLNNFNITGCGQDANGNANPNPNEDLVGHNDWANIKYRAVLAPGASFIPLPSGPELTFEDAQKIQVQVLEALKPDPAVSQTVAPDPVLTGSNVTYTITLVNNRPTPATNVVVKDDLPASTSFISCTATGGGVCGGSNNQRMITFAELAGNASATIIILANINCAVANDTSIANTATVSSATPDGNPSNNNATATVKASNPPPVISNLAVSPSVLWPPDHKMRNVSISYTVIDNCGTPTVALNAASNEPINGLGDGDTATDWAVITANLIQLRAERSGTGAGRLYTVTVRATDSGGGSSAQTVNVTVPHNN